MNMNAENVMLMSSLATIGKCNKVKIKLMKQNQHKRPNNISYSRVQLCNLIMISFDMKTV